LKYSKSTFFVLFWKIQAEIHTHVTCRIQNRAGTLNQWSVFVLLPFFSLYCVIHNTCVSLDLTIYINDVYLYCYHSSLYTVSYIIHVFHWVHPCKSTENVKMCLNHHGASPGGKWPWNNVLTNFRKLYMYKNRYGRIVIYRNSLFSH
jgi:hypothetical protein